MLLNKLLCAEVRLSSPLCKELSFLFFVKNFLIYTGNIQDRRKLRMHLFHTSNCLVVQFTNQKVGSESQYFQGHPVGFFQRCSQESCLPRQQNYITSPHCPMHVLHTAAAVIVNRELTTPYLGYGSQKLLLRLYSQKEFSLLNRKQRCARNTNSGRIY